MRKKCKQFILIFIMTVLLLGVFKLNCYAKEVSPKGSLYFAESPDFESDPRWYGQFQGSIKSDKVRITLYDDRINIIETGLVTEYFQNTTEGYYLDLKNWNNNNKLDGTDDIFVYNRGEVQPDWGVVITYEPTGEPVASTTLSNERFSLIKEKEEDYSLAIIFLIIELIICALIFMFVLSYKRRK